MSLFYKKLQARFFCLFFPFGCTCFTITAPKQFVAIFWKFSRLLTEHFWVWYSRKDIRVTLMKTSDSQSLSGVWQIKYYIGSNASLYFITRHQLKRYTIVLWPTVITLIYSSSFFNLEKMEVYLSLVDDHLFCLLNAVFFCRTDLFPLKMSWNALSGRIKPWSSLVALNKRLLATVGDSFMITCTSPAARAPFSVPSSFSAVALSWPPSHPNTLP